MKKKKKPRSKAKPKAKKVKTKKVESQSKGKTKAKAKKIFFKTAERKRLKRQPPKSGVIAPLNSVLLGFVEDYFAKIGVIALTLQAPVSVGQKIQVLGHTTHLEQVVDSLQINHVPVSHAGPKDGIGIKVTDRARGGDHVYLLK